MTPEEKLIADHEGLSLTPYRDTAGKLTIGYGRNLNDKGITLEEFNAMLIGGELKLTTAGAVLLMRIDMAEANAAVARALPDIYQQGTPRTFVLVSMAFNMGIGGLLTFKKMLAAMRRWEFDIAAYEMLESKWAREDVAESRSTCLARIMRENIFDAGLK
jgi:lysozyme